MKLYITHMFIADIINNVNDTNLFLTLRKKAKAFAGNWNGMSAIDPIGAIIYRVTKAVANSSFSPSPHPSVVTY